ncbi:hypothetical protein RF55_15095 [Lasius niger]|uniref:Peptidase A2 domain-containing protein n=1 Tax=Lasius niger TaxID=67767 RepID=A0A0J7N046_LASNI|nr:hypothetical protein RF55_15095 [Lasius niger]
MDKVIEDLIHNQIELHGHISRMVENLRKLGQANITSDAVESRLTSLENHWSRFEEQHTTLVTVHRDAVRNLDYKKKDYIGTVEDTYLTQKGILLDYAAELARQNQPPTTRTESTTSRSTLPRIQLPQFSGKYEDWPAFRDLFQSMIGKDGNLSGVEKLHYLKVSVKADAESLIKNLPTTSENYNRAWNTLCEHFENKRLLVRSCLQKFTSLPKMKSESATELRKILHGVASTAGTLESIGRPIDSSEDLFVFSIVELLDSRSRREWENGISDSPSPPTFGSLKRFLERRLQTLEAIQPVKSEVVGNKTSENSSRTARTHHVQKREPGRCTLCKKDHALMVCDDYKSKTAHSRRQLVDGNNLCANCLGKHKIADCPSKRLCSVCSEKHHTSLHDAFRKVLKEDSAEKTSLVAHSASQRRSTVLLATARIRISDRFGNLQEARALIDQGSEATIITEKLAQRLRLPRRHTSITVFGVGGQQTGVAKGSVSVSVWPRSGKTSVSASALILPRLTVYASSSDASPTEWSHIRGLDLADPNLASSDPIDILLGADVYAGILCEGLRKGTRLQPVAQNTIFGWILSGKIGSAEEEEGIATHQCTVGESLSSLVRQFWEQEELELSPTPLTSEEQECEDLFVSTHSRDQEGRYVVRLPVKSSLPDLSETRTAAVRSLLRSEKRFLREKGFRDLYKEFMTTYEVMNHMSRAGAGDHKTKRICYLPHHEVLKESSASTRLRVVFNGSWAVSSGTSLNQHLMVGKNLLPALTDVLLRWRWHRYVLATDVEKMYRQIVVHEEDRDLQRIFWRSDIKAEMSEFRLNTVTYGLACAPFLAVRTLQQLARDEAERFPLGSSVLLQDVYVDDVLTGADTIEEAMDTQDQLIGLCKAGGFPLKKWASNSAELVSNIPAEDRMLLNARAWMPQETNHSMLGLLWNPEADCFTFAAKVPEEDVVTKRSILSQSAQLFDPLGWLTPVTIFAKIAIQSTWLLGLDWDASLPEREAGHWRKFREVLPLLSRIKIPRTLVKGSHNNIKTLHGFADASERAYAAVLYLQAEDDNGQVTTSLITAKSKVAPIKL